MNIRKKILQIKSRIAYNLPRSVIMNIATTIDFIKSRPFALKLFFAQQKIAKITAFSESINMRMFHKKQ